MILCVGLNPALDRRIVLDELRLGHVNRARESMAFAGGKAAHVAVAARALGQPVTWLGFLGGRTGQTCRDDLERLGIACEVVDVPGETRTNLELLSESGITEVLEPGAPLPEGAFDELARRFSALLPHVRPQAVAISGSLPAGLSRDACAKLALAARAHACAVAVDTSGLALELAVAAAPDLVKPNEHEAEQLLRSFAASHLVGSSPRGFGHDRAAAALAARAITERGPRTAIVSLGAQGFVVAAEGSLHHVLAPEVEVLSTVGCGDALVAGWCVARAQGLPHEQSLRLSAACAAANCRALAPGQIRAEAVAQLVERVVIRRL
jgi:tagatose 6-phosphate kinase